jgi:hypothetical protein
VQKDVPRLLVSHRDRESYVVGGAPLNRKGPRDAGDIDIFHIHAEHIAPAALTTRNPSQPL